MLCRLLEDWGYACSEAADGVAALEFASTHGVALIVTDLDMPRLDGLGLILAVLIKPVEARRLRALFASVLAGNALHPPADRSGSGRRAPRLDGPAA